MNPKDSAPEEIKAKLGDRIWRLNNLYFVKDKAGVKIPFRLNWAQTELLDGLWFFSLVLKARQLGVTTFFCILYLDDVLFSKNKSAAIIAHRLEDAKKIFRDKIKFAWDQLPGWLRACYDVNTDSASELVFSLKGQDGTPGKDSSMISVSTSVRSGTVQRLHITELGYIDRHYPEKAQEIRTGALNAVQAGQLVTIESTAAGRDGLFYELVTKAQTSAKLGRALSKLDFKFFFFPWWRHPEYVLETEVVVTKEQEAYFEELEPKIGVLLTPQQRWWYAKKAEVEGDEMLSEYPSTPEEAFMASIEGAYYATQVGQALREHRLRPVPWEPLVPVETWWDLGMDDYMVIVFVQYVGAEIRVIDVEYGSGEGLAHYAKILREKPYAYSRHVMPHDVRVKELGTGKSRYEVAGQLGLRPITIAVQPNGQPNGQAFAKEDQIEAVRSVFPRLVFDEVKASKLFADLQSYRKAWDERLSQFRSEPVHDDHSHGADAVATGAVMTRVVRGAAYEPMNPEAPGRSGGEIRPDNDGEV